jgi:hypothetical protein
MMRSIRTIFLLALLTLSGSVAYAQAATPTSKFLLDIVAADAPTAQAYTWRLYLDGAATGTVVSGVTCASASGVITCTVPFPAMTPGSHSATFTAANTAGESAKSAAVTFALVVVPNTPRTRG